MSFSLSISGHVTDESQAEGGEQSLIDDLLGVLEKHADKVNFASGQFQYSGQRDLLAEIAAGQSTSETPDPDPTDGATESPNPDAGETADGASEPGPGAVGDVPTP